MKQRDLQAVLLVKAIEEADAQGTLISMERREEATRHALREQNLPEEGPAADVEPGKLAKTISDRAHSLLRDVFRRHSVLEDLLALSRWRSWMGVVVVGVAFALSVSASVIPRQINLLGLPYVSVVFWNLAIYVWLLFGGLFKLGSGGPGVTRLLSVFARWVESRLTRVLTSSQSDPTVQGVAWRFFEDWRGAAAPVFSQRVRVLLHAGAACMGFGLIAGLYLHLLREHHEVVWESSLLEARQIKWIVDHVLALPASLLGIQLSPSLEDLERMRRTSTEIVGASARPWVDLLALLLLFVVVLPRLVLAAVAAAKSGWLQRSAYLPDYVADYTRAVLGVEAAPASVIVNVVPYDSEHAEDTGTRLNTYFRRRFGRGAGCRVLPVVDVGNEHSIEQLIRNAGVGADRWVLLVNLESKPDGDTHGILLIAARDAVTGLPKNIPIQILVDEHVEQGRLEPDFWYASKLDRRRKEWRKYARASRTEVGFLPV